MEANENNVTTTLFESGKPPTLLQRIGMQVPLIGTAAQQMWAEQREDTAIQRQVADMKKKPASTQYLRIVVVALQVVRQLLSIMDQAQCKQYQVQYQQKMQIEQKKKLQTIICNYWKKSTTLKQHSNLLKC